jgi:hypothetical protein
VTGRASLATNCLLSRIWVFDRRSMENFAMEFVVFAVTSWTAYEYDIPPQKSA